MKLCLPVTRAFAELPADAIPRVNLLIADDVGLGKTVEAGLVLREMLLRRRVDFVVVSAPAAMITQWQDELAQKFGLGFTIVDRDYLAAVRRAHGFAANPWAVGSRFIVSHSLLADETYSSGLKDALGPFRPRALLILDEVHHAAPASGQAYAVDSQFTNAVRALAERFEHRLFLSATRTMDIQTALPRSSRFSTRSGSRADFRLSCVWPFAFSTARASTPLRANRKLTARPSIWWRNFCRTSLV
jgi:SNF2 family DNA or RNA helicase